MTRLSHGQLAVMDQFNRVARITKEIPHYWDPKPLLNDQIDRLEARGFIERDDGSQSRHAGFYKITVKGAARIGMEVCNPCGGATHATEAACIHCGKMKDWAQEQPSPAALAAQGDDAQEGTPKTWGEWERKQQESDR